MPCEADGDKENLQPDPPQIRFLNISFVACGENLKESSTAQIFSWQGKSFEALKWSQNKLHDLGMNTMCWQHHQFTALKATFRTAFLGAHCRVVIQTDFLDGRQRVKWNTSMGCFCGHACMLISIDIKGWGHSPMRSRRELELSGERSPAVSPHKSEVSLQGEWRGKGIIGAQSGRGIATNTEAWFRLI